MHNVELEGAEPIFSAVTQAGQKQQRCSCKFIGTERVPLAEPQVTALCPLLRSGGRLLAEWLRRTFEHRLYKPGIDG